MKSDILLGVPYGRGACKIAAERAPGYAPMRVAQMFPEQKCIMVTPDAFDADRCQHDRFGENLDIQKRLYAATPREPHVMIGGDHSINFGHVAAIADNLDTSDLCMIYIDAHLDMHTPESSRAQASGAPHGTNVRAALGDGDARWLQLPNRHPILRPENVFYLASRAWEDAEIDFIKAHNIFMKTANELTTPEHIANITSDIRTRIGDRPYIISFDLDAISPTLFPEVLVPEPNGISVDAARQILTEFAPGAYSIEFVEWAAGDNAKCADIVRELVDIAINA